MERGSSAQAIDDRTSSRSGDALRSLMVREGAGRYVVDVRQMEEWNGEGTARHPGEWVGATQRMIQER